MDCTIQENVRSDVARVSLEKLETVYTRENAIVSKTGELSAENSALSSGMSRVSSVMTGKTFPVVEVKAKRRTELTVAPPFPGELAVVTSNTEMKIQSLSFVCVDKDSELSYEADTMYENDEIALVNLPPKTTCIIGGFGGLDKISLDKNESVDVNVAYVAAFTSGLLSDEESGLLDKFGLSGSITGVARFTGPGSLYIHSRSLTRFSELAGKLD